MTAPLPWAALPESCTAGKRADNRGKTRTNPSIAICSCTARVERHCAPYIAQRCHTLALLHLLILLLSPVKVLACLYDTLTTHVRQPCCGKQTKFHRRKKMMLESQAWMGVEGAQPTAWSPGQQTCTSSQQRIPRKTKTLTQLQQYCRRAGSVARMRARSPRLRWATSRRGGADPGFTPIEILEYEKIQVSKKHKRVA